MVGKLGWSWVVCALATLGCGSDSKHSASTAAGAGGTTTSTGGTQASESNTSGSGAGGSGNGAGGASTNGVSTSAGGSEGIGGSSGAGGAATTGGGTGGSSGSAGAGGVPGDVPLPPKLTWTKEAVSGIFEEVWASGPDDIYAVGRSGSLVHSTGDGQWQWQDSGTGLNLEAVWGSGPNDVYVAMYGNAIYHSVGDGEWVHWVHTGISTFLDIHGTSATNVWAATGSLRRVSDGGSSLGPSLDIGGTYGTWKIWAVGEGQLWSVNPYGAVVYYDVGTDERNGKQLGELAVYQLEDVWATSPTNAYVCGSDALFHTSDGENWENELPASAGNVRLNALHGIDENNVYACGAKFYRSNGHGEWSDPEDFQPNPESSISCLGIWAISPDNIYLATTSGIFHGTPE